MSAPARTGVLVAVGVAFGRTAVWAPAPIETKATFGPSFTILTEFPWPGSEVLALAVAVTATGFVRLVAENGLVVAILYPFTTLRSCFPQVI